MGILIYFNVSIGIMELFVRFFSQQEDPDKIERLKEEVSKVSKEKRSLDFGAFKLQLKSLSKDFRYHLFSCQSA